MDKNIFSQGYVSDTTYADKFYKELSPVWLNYVATINGGEPRDISQDFTYLESALLSWSQQKSEKMTIENLLFKLRNLSLIS